MIKKLLIDDLRNIPTLSASFHSTLNFIIGDNGSGKSSILEAIFYIAHGKSFRTSTSADLIRNGKDFFSIGIRTNDNIQLGIRKGQTSNSIYNELRIDNEKCHKLSVFAKNIAVQIIMPESFYLFFGGPKQRRKFVDLGLFHVKHHFSKQWQLFNKVLKQRNAALKNKCSFDMLAHWTSLFVDKSALISELRAEYIEALSHELQYWLKLLLPTINKNIAIKYYRGWSSKQTLTTLLEKQYQREIQLGHTVAGAHKFDLQFLISGQTIEKTLSRGQQKLFLIALTFSQAQLIERANQLKPILLIDDVGAELDMNSRTLLHNAIGHLNSQVIITAIDKQALIQLIPEKEYNMFHVKHGKLSAITEQAEKYGN